MFEDLMSHCLAYLILLNFKFITIHLFISPEIQPKLNISNSESSFVYSKSQPFHYCIKWSLLLLHKSNHGSFPFLVP